MNGVNNSGNVSSSKFAVVGTASSPLRLFVSSVTGFVVNPVSVLRSLSRGSKFANAPVFAALPSRITAPPASANSATAVRSACVNSVVGVEIIRARAAGLPSVTRSGPESLARLTVPSKPINSSSAVDWPSRYRR